MACKQRSALFVSFCQTTRSVVLLLFLASPLWALQQGRVSCKPIGQKTSEIGCWILATQDVGTSARQLFWTLDVYPTKSAAESARGLGGVVVETLGKVWLFTVGEKPDLHPAGIRMTQMGPLAFKPGTSYRAQFMEATLEPGMVSRTHSHTGIEAFYTESGRTCLETPSGVQIGRNGVDIVIPEGVPMEMTAIGAEPRRGLMLVLHDASKPATTVVDTWHSKNLCASAK